MSAVSDVNQLGEIPLFRGPSHEQLIGLNELLHHKSLPPHSTFITADQMGEVLYVILSGSVKIHLEQPDCSDVIVAILGPGEIVGEMSLINNTGHCANVTTLEQSVILWMDRTAFNECLRTIPMLNNNLTRIMAQRLREANEQIHSLATMDIEGRIARQIILFAQRYGKTVGDGVLIPVRLTQTDFAGLIGASRERINQVIVSYKERGYISVDRNYHITIHNQSALMKRCQKPAQDLQ